MSYQDSAEHWGMQVTRIDYFTVKSQSSFIQYASSRRFDPLFQDIWKAVREGTVGDIQLMKLTDRDSPKPSYEFLLNTGTRSSL